MDKKIFILMFIVLLSSSVFASVIFEDDFNRVNSATVGNGWTEIENAGTTVAISSNTLLLSDASGSKSVDVQQHTTID